MPYKSNILDPNRATYNGTSKHVQQGIIVSEYTTTPSWSYAVEMYIPLPYEYDKYTIIVNSIYINILGKWCLMMQEEDTTPPNEAGGYRINNNNGMAEITLGGRATMLSFSTTYPVQVSYIAIRK